MVGETDVLEALALELSNDLLEAVGVSVNADGGEDLLDVGGRGGLVASEGEEEVSCEVLHFDLTVSKKNIVVSVDVKTLDAKRSRCVRWRVFRGTETERIQRDIPLVAWLTGTEKQSI